MSKLTKWKPRASQIGGYFACGQRAGLDRLVHDKVIEPPGCDETSGYAAFGSLCHSRWQDLLGAVRETAEEPDRAASDQAAALAHFNGDAAALTAAVEKVAALAVRNTPTLAPGATWRAEVGLKHRDMTGHIDLLASDGSWMIDLKTTSRKPDHSRPKAAHLYQLAAYAYMLPERPARGMLLYVDSTPKAAWALPCGYDLGEEGQRELSQQVEAYARHLRTAGFLRTAVPNLGPHCSGGFCPYVQMCRERYTPPAATLFVAPATPLFIPEEKDPLL